MLPCRGFEPQPPAPATRDAAAGGGGPKAGAGGGGGDPTPHPPPRARLPSLHQPGDTVLYRTAEGAYVEAVSGRVAHICTHPRTPLWQEQGAVPTTAVHLRVVRAALIYDQSCCVCLHVTWVQVVDQVDISVQPPQYGIRLPGARDLRFTEQHRLLSTQPPAAVAAAAAGVGARSMPHVSPVCINSLFGD